MADWKLLGRPACKKREYHDPEITFELTPTAYANRKKGGKFVVEVSGEQLGWLHELTGRLLKETQAADAIEDELEQYSHQLNDERDQFLAKKRAGLRAKAGLDPDQQDEQVAERERKEALEHLDCLREEDVAKAVADYEVTFNAMSDDELDSI
jgi:hypothetical protein